MARTVLVADDSPSVQKKALGILKGEGFEVETVSNGVAAIKRLAVLHPVVVLADVSMPGRDGYEVCEFVKKSVELSHVPVLLVASEMEPYDDARGQEVRADGIIKKPFEANELVSIVGKFADQYEAATVANIAPDTPAVSPAPPPEFAFPFEPSAEQAPGPYLPPIPAMAPEGVAFTEPVLEEPPAYGLGSASVETQAPQAQLEMAPESAPAPEFVAPYGAPAEMPAALYAALEPSVVSEGAAYGEQPPLEQAAPYIPEPAPPASVSAPEDTGYAEPPLEQPAYYEPMPVPPVSASVPEAVAYPEASLEPVPDYQPQPAPPISANLPEGVAYAEPFLEQTPASPPEFESVASATTPQEIGSIESTWDQGPVFVPQPSPAKMQFGDLPAEPEIAAGAAPAPEPSAQPETPLEWPPLVHAESAPILPAEAAHNGPTMGAPQSFAPEPPPSQGEVAYTEPEAALGMPPELGPVPEFFEAGPSPESPGVRPLEIPSVTEEVPSPGPAVSSAPAEPSPSFFESFENEQAEPVFIEEQSAQAPDVAIARAEFSTMIFRAPLEIAEPVWRDETLPASPEPESGVAPILESAPGAEAGTVPPETAVEKPPPEPSPIESLPWEEPSSLPSMAVPIAGVTSLEGFSLEQAAAGQIRYASEAELAEPVEATAPAPAEELPAVEVAPPGPAQVASTEVALGDRLPEPASTDETHSEAPREVVAALTGPLEASPEATSPEPVAVPATPPQAIDWEMVYSVVHKVVVKMSPPPLPADAVEEMARRLAEEIAAEIRLESSPPQT